MIAPRGTGGEGKECGEFNKLPDKRVIRTSVSCGKRRGEVDDREG